MGSGAKPGRNDRCPCGSGRKFKLCCDRADPQSIAAARASSARAQGAALVAARRYEESIAPLLLAARLRPGDAGALSDLGLACLYTHRLAQAVACFRQSLSLRPGSGDTHFNLGLALEQTGDREAALASHRRAVLLAPKLAEGYARIAELLLQKGEPLLAASAYDEASLAAPGTTLGDLCGATSLTLRGRPREAEQRLRLLVARDAASIDAHVFLGSLLSEAGQFEGAAASFESAIALAPSHATAHHGLVSSRRLTEADRPVLERIALRLLDRDLPDPARVTLHFAAGKAFEDLGDYELAMHQFDAANLVRRSLARPFDPRDFEARVGRLIDRFTIDLFRDLAALGSADETPLLVVGMPRSGTTLVERVLSSHPRVFGAGELAFWNTHASVCADADDAKLREAADGISAEYTRVLRAAGPGALRVTDKMPFNFLWLGVVHAFFPRARIIHCRRGPVDTCLSIYSTLFAQPWGFASDLGDLAAYYRQYARLMAHWRNVLPADRLLDVDYEELTAAPEDVTRRVVAFAGLEWEPACLHPEDNADAIRTASKWQARQAVFRTSVERWRRFEPWIGELRSLASP